MTFTLDLDINSTPVGRPPSSEWDVIIVGAGPAGMAAALYTGRARLRTLLIDRLGTSGGQLRNTELIEDYPGFKSISGERLARTFEEQIVQFGVEITWAEAIRVEARGDRRVVRTGDGTEFVGKTVIVASGGAPRKLGVPGEQEFANRGVSYCAICDGAFFTDLAVAVIGGGDSAIEEAIFLTRYARPVYVIHRRHEWRAQRLIQERAIKNSRIEPIWYSTVEEIGGRDTVEWVSLRRACTLQATCAASTSGKSPTRWVTRQPRRWLPRITSRSWTRPAQSRRPRTSSLASVKRTGASREINPV